MCTQTEGALHAGCHQLVGFFHQDLWVMILIMFSAPSVNKVFTFQNSVTHYRVWPLPHGSLRSLRSASGPHAGGKINIKFVCGWPPVGPRSFIFSRVAKD